MLLVLKDSILEVLEVRSLKNIDGNTLKLEIDQALQRKFQAVLTVNLEQTAPQSRSALFA